MSQQILNVAVPWSLSHYIPLNGFHPLYRALFDQVPPGIELHAWDNVKLHNRFERDIEIRNIVLQAANEENGKLKKLGGLSIAHAYQEYFWPPNHVLTEALAGDIEFHHTAPYPSLKRPFIFHCESFAPVFLPFTQQGSGEFKNHEKLRDHYRQILANPLCLGIFSHIPETLGSLSRFFADTDIDKKLFSSKIGLSSKAIVEQDIPEKSPLSRPKFLFVNSANQNPLNFFRCGGHIVLRFWEEFIRTGRNGFLMLRCTKPSDEALREYGVSMSFLKAETGHSIIWAEDYLANHEMNALMASAHFFLLPSASLHSVSIMQAMALGTIPVVTDTVGTGVYVQDQEHGIVLRGVRAAIWHVDTNTGILVDRYCKMPSLDESLVSQMTSRIFHLLDETGAYQQMRSRIMVHAQQQFSGEAFSQNFWNAVLELCKDHKKIAVAHSPVSLESGGGLQDCTLQDNDWARVFEGVTQPVRKIYTGQSGVWELGGSLIHVQGNPRIELNDWSVFARYFDPASPEISFATTLDELEGKYLSFSAEVNSGVDRKLVAFISRLLMPYPELHSFAANVLKRIRRYHKFLTYMAPDNSDSSPQLVVDDFFGFNIICFQGKFYAILQGEGAFEYARILSKNYSRFFTGDSLAEVKEAVSININAQKAAALQLE